MKLHYKDNQQFQIDATKAVVDVFTGQPRLLSSFSMISFFPNNYQINWNDSQSFTGWRNHPIDTRHLSNQQILQQLQEVQKRNNIEPSNSLEGTYNLTIEMETGVGKTYTYIKTMYELNKHYGWSKYIVVVPSIAIREGVYKSFQDTSAHFLGMYGKSIKFFIYNPDKLSDISGFSANDSISVMIINSQAFNNPNRRIYLRSDYFKSRRPIDIIASTNPIVIIDEPQSVEGNNANNNARRKLSEFNPLITLRYSATHRPDRIFNMVYRLDAVDAYNNNLVKKIAVKGIRESGNVANGYVYLQSINLSDTASPSASIQFDCIGANDIFRLYRTVGIGFNLFEGSGGLAAYTDNYIIESIDGRDNTVGFRNGIVMQVGDVIGVNDANRNQLRRVQIRETILSHIERERKVYSKGIKVLSLFFIDEVRNYKSYDGGIESNGIYAEIFETEYRDIVNHLSMNLGEEKYFEYLNGIDAHDTHAGYFSIDKRSGHMINSEIRRNLDTTDDSDAYDLIMRNKERLLSFEEPTRFIFSHSALREGWDNPNVFQICTLKDVLNNNNIRRRQEVGRGMRICVNQNGERMDFNELGSEFHDVNKLTIIASESYESFSNGLQTEIADAVSYRPRAITDDLFVNKMVSDENGNERRVDAQFAHKIWLGLYHNDYINDEGLPEDRYFSDRDNNEFELPDEINSYAGSIVKIIDSVYNGQIMKPENARDDNVELHINTDNFSSTAFNELWKRINSKSVYRVNFDPDLLVNNSIASLNRNLHIPANFFEVEQGEMDLANPGALANGAAFIRMAGEPAYPIRDNAVSQNIKYDLIGELVDKTSLTRKTVVAILTGLDDTVFNQFYNNPDEFILRASSLINDEKAAIIVEHISYNKLNDCYSTDIFTEQTLKGRLNVNAMSVNHHLYDHVIYDSAIEHDFAIQLDNSGDVSVYVKLPKGFYITTPVGNYNPDWAIAFNEGDIKHIYFVAETKGSSRNRNLRGDERDKIKCATEHFKVISSGEVTYDVVDSFETLMELVR